MSDKSAIALARATLARLVAELFVEPDAAWAARLSANELRAELESAAARLSLPSRAVLGPGCPIGPPLDAAALAERYSAVLGHTVRCDCPPYELEYARSDVFQHAHSLADIAAFYRAFGLETGGPMHERADHIVAEWEFLAVSALKEAQAPPVEGSGPRPRAAEKAERCRAAQRAFLKDHAAIWMPAFFSRLRSADPDGFFARAANLAEALLCEWCLALDVPLGPDWLELRPAEEEDRSIDCGPGPGPGQVQLGAALAQAGECGRPARVFMDEGRPS